MKPEDLTLEHVMKIGELYVQYCGIGAEKFATNRFKEAETLLENIQNGGAFFGGYRIGSNWDMLSKLEFNLEEGHLVPGMHPNFHPSDKSVEQYEEAQQAAENFQKACLEYLAS